nr:CPBP family intramembrane glutamic endopeptidase [uncultured Methanomethylovorans sp.]
MFTIKDTITTTISITATIFGVLGEEYGWRGYLLPELTKIRGKTNSTIIVGIVWALYHVPAVYLLARATGSSNPLIVCFIQACAIFTLSFPFSYCFYLSKNMLPVILFHSIWNALNTIILGDIYRNEQGIIGGNLIFLNGEGLIGLILGTCLIYWFIKQFKKDESRARKL